MSGLLWVAVAALLVGGGSYGLYKYYLHPAWRRERRVRRACEKAFRGDYRLLRVRLRADDPSGGDLFLIGPLGPSEPPRYYTYRIEAEEDPEFSDMSRREVELVRHYLGRNVSVPHHGMEVLRSTNTPASVKGDAQ